ncbi:Phosphate-regulating neutral endopeptidase [Aphelenchoides bicaudatus]|nr:Phosphate-regulating neutral endopeptidase [Aphelenchoides bicaudatus]
MDKHEALNEKCLKDSLTKGPQTSSSSIRKMRMYRDVYSKSNFNDYALSPSKMMKELDSFGSCPLFKNNWSSSKFNPTDVALKIAHLTGEMIHLCFYNWQMPDGSIALVFEILNETDYKYHEVFDSRDRPIPTVVNKMVEEIRSNVTLILMESSTSTRKTSSQIREMARRSVEIELKVWQAMKKAGIYDDDWSPIYNRYGYFLHYSNMPFTKLRFENLASILPIFELRYLYDSSWVSTELRSHLLKNPFIHVENIQLFRDLRAIFDKVSKRGLTNYLCLKYMYFESEYLNLEGKAKSKARNNMDIVELLQAEFPLLSDHLYTKKCVNSSALKAVQEMIPQIKQSAAQIIQQNKWLDGKSKSYALFKLQSMRSMVVALNISSDLQKLGEYYAELRFTSKDTLRDLNRKLHLFQQQKQLLSFVRPEVYIREISNRASEMNAYHYKAHNAIHILGGYLFVPNVDLNMPSAVNYGTIGRVISHEIFHGFDPRGIDFDAIGASKSWLTSKSLKEFTKRAECIEQQYGQIRALGFLQINGTRTLNENMADNDAVRAAFLAYKSQPKSCKTVPGYEHYSSDQAFFIGFGVAQCETHSNAYKKYLLEEDTHPPREYRVNEVVKNFPEFSKTFNCPRRSPMNPIKKCRVW